jgi:hypothetical protein
MTVHRNGGKYSKLKENHHIFFRPNGAIVVQIQNNGVKVSRSFDNIETARKWRDETIAAIPVPIVKFLPKTVIYPAPPEVVKTKPAAVFKDTRRYVSRMEYTPADPVNIGPTVVTWT